MKIRVGIVEDEKPIRESLQTLLSHSEKFECVGAYETAEDALINIPKSKPHVVLMDIHLPGKSGIECIASLIEKQVTCQFLMCTSFEDPEHVFQALKAGATGYMIKITPPEKLLESIEDVYNGGSPMSSSIARKVVAHFQSTPPSEELKKLSEREKGILELLSKGYRYKEIAAKLFISTETVRKHIRNIYEKLQVNSRTEALNKVYPRN